MQIVINVGYKQLNYLSFDTKIIKFGWKLTEIWAFKDVIDRKLVQSM